MSSYLKRAKQALVLVFYLAFAVKLLIPVGYMPTAIGDGWPLRLCDAGLSGAVFSETGRQHEHDHDHDGEQDELQWEHCPLGALAAANGIPIEHHIELSFRGQDFSPGQHVIQSIATRVVGFRSRAPPYNVLHA